jgi:very-short-patch-repair endonuclease
MTLCSASTPQAGTCGTDETGIIMGDAWIWRTSTLLKQGMNADSIARAVKEGTLFRPFHGIYTPRQPTDEELLGIFASLRDGLVYTGQAAGFLYGIVPLTWPAPARVPRRSSHNGGERFRLSEGQTRRTRTLRGIPVTSPLETTVMLNLPDDVLRTFLTEQYLGVKGNDALAEDLAALPPRKRRRAGVLLEDLVTGTASSYELKAATAITAALDGIEVEVKINAMVEGYRFDLVIEDADVLIEIDGFAFHGGASTTQDDQIRDCWKRNAVTRSGYTLLCYTGRCVEYATTEMVEQVLDTVTYNLRHPRTRRKRTAGERMSTDAQVWTWHSAMGEFWEMGRF